ncbi:HAMP domain-containing sensor histidine kinase [Dapis sp. BLCC M172]|uniref:HAMP domain-containing sensor histidine kinase n=1 Tax=Dapis sp. BLCC M172 TaxID=2975281 RepID=UPI003CF3D417
MQKSPLNPIFCQLSPKLPLRAIVIVPFVLQIISAVGLVGYLSFTNGKRAVNDLAHQLQNEITVRIQKKLDIYLETPHLVNQLNVNAIRLDQLNIQATNDLELHLWNQIQSFDSIGVIGITSTSGTMVAVSRQDNNALNIIVTDKSTNGELHEYTTNSQGGRTQRTKVVPQYDFRLRPWYQDGIGAAQAAWGKMFTSLIDEKVKMMATRPVVDNDGNVIALVNATLTFSQVHEFLQQLNISKSGEAFILNRSGELIASSGKTDSFINNNNDSKLIDALDSKDPLIRLASQHLRDRFGDLNQIQNTSLLKFDIDGKQQFLQVVPFSDKYGLDWLILVVVPEADFMGRIYANTRITVALCLMAFILAIFLGLLSCELIIRPVKRLKEAATSLSVGNWEQKVKEVPIDELAILAQSFNQMTEQVEKSFVELERKNAALQEADRYKDEFMKNISHELRTPLNSIICSLKLVLDNFCDSPEEETELLEQADKSAIHLLDLIDELLDLVQIKEGKLIIEKKLVNLSECLSEIIDSQQPLIQQKNLELYKPNMSKSIFVEADPTKLKQIFLNVIDNAIKFTETGSITIDIQLKPGMNTYYIDEIPIAVVTIQDTGIGVEPSQQQQLFQSFVMQDGSTTRAYNGCGLGLAISRSLMELMGGNITLESAGKNQGTTVYISLPITLQTSDYS